VLWVLAAIAVLGGVAMVAAGRGTGLTESEPDRPDVQVPPDRAMDKDDVDALRFSVGLRGYRMDEVDDVLDRLAGELALRDARIAELEGAAPASQPGEVPGATLGSVAPAASADEPQERDDRPYEPPTSRTLIVPVQELHADPPPSDAG
jgi:DivIVA domain-containing protein